MMFLAVFLCLVAVTKLQSGESMNEKSIYEELFKVCDRIYLHNFKGEKWSIDKKNSFEKINRWLSKNVPKPTPESEIGAVMPSYTLSLYKESSEGEKLIREIDLYETLSRSDPQIVISKDSFNELKNYFSKVNSTRQP